jgi:hypothetical protein
MLDKEVPQVVAVEEDEVLVPGADLHLPLPDERAPLRGYPFPNHVCPCVSEKLYSHPAEPGRAAAAHAPGLVYGRGSRGRSYGRYGRTVWSRSGDRQGRPSSPTRSTTQNSKLPSTSLRKPLRSVSLS